MEAYKLNVNVGAERKLAMELPADSPQGSAEVIVLADRMSAEARAALPTVSTAASPSGPAPEPGDEKRPIDAEFLRLFPADPRLGRIACHEDPTATLTDEDWPEAGNDAPS